MPSALSVQLVSSDQSVNMGTISGPGPDTAPPPGPASWGLHLWDRTEEVFAYTVGDVASLTATYAKFYKELAEVEKDYAKGVRKLCNKFAPKQEASGQESERDRGWRLFLTEQGYKAGQHELLSELYSKSVIEDLKTKVKDSNKEIEKLRKELKRSQEVTEHVQKSHEKYNVKYQKCFQDAVTAERALQRAENDTSLSRREVEKLRNQTAERQRQSDESKKVLERQTSHLQEVTTAHLHGALPAVLDSLQGLSVATSESLMRVMEAGVRSEAECERVVAACTQEMASILAGLRPHRDSERVIEMFKSGAVASAESLSRALVNTSHLKHSTNTIKKSKSFTKIPTEKDNQSAYQNKRKLESKLEALEEEIAKGEEAKFAKWLPNNVHFITGRKEMSALQLMVKSYTENPQFGDVNKFRSELDKVTHSVQLLESDLFSLNNQLRDVSSKLHVTRAPSEIYSSTCSDRSDTQSQSSGYPSSASSGDMDSQFGETSSARDSQCGDNDSYRDAIQSLLTQSPGYYVPQLHSRHHDEAHDDVREAVHGEDLPPPPAELLEDETDGLGPEADQVTVTALYSFDVIAEGNIGMAEGEEVIVTGQDDGGWIRVRRVREPQDEGFVPTAFLNLPSFM